MRPKCEKCGTRNVHNRGGRRKDGSLCFRKLCQPCRAYGGLARDQLYRRHLKSSCERCGFLPEDCCQLDVDHVDGDRTNNDPLNLMTLCANCHRLKTKRNADWSVKPVGPRERKGSYAR